MVNFLPIISTLNFYLVNNILRSLTLKLDLCTEWFLTRRKWPPPSRPLKLYIFFIIYFSIICELIAVTNVWTLVFLG